MQATDSLTERTLAGLHAYLAEQVVLRCGGVRSTVLDVGCGSGAWLNRLGGLGFGPVVGIDQDPPVVAGLDLRQRDLNSGQGEPLGTFRLVTCIEVIEHVENVGLLLDLLATCVCPSAGLILLTTPNIESLRARLRGLLSGKTPGFDAKSDPTHLMPVLEEGLDRMLARRGLQRVGTSYYPPTPTRSVMYRGTVRSLANLLRPVLGDPRYGDTAVHWIARSEAQYSGRNSSLVI